MPQQSHRRSRVAIEDGVHCGENAGLPGLGYHLPHVGFLNRPAGAIQGEFLQFPVQGPQVIVQEAGQGSHRLGSDGCSLTLRPVLDPNRQRIPGRRVLYVDFTVGLQHPEQRVVLGNRPIGEHQDGGLRHVGNYVRQRCPFPDAPLGLPPARLPAPSPALPGLEGPQQALNDDDPLGVQEGHDVAQPHQLGGTGLVGGQPVPVGVQRQGLTLPGLHCLEPFRNQEAVPENDVSRQRTVPAWSF